MSVPVQTEQSGRAASPRGETERQGDCFGVSWTMRVHIRQHLPLGFHPRRLLILVQLVGVSFRFEKIAEAIVEVLEPLPKLLVLGLQILLSRCYARPSDV